MNLPYKLSTDRPKQLGLIVLQSDESVEPDMRRLIPADVEFLISRVPSGRSVTPESLAAMEDHLTQSARLFPEGARLAAVGYGCTSGTAQIGALRVRELIQSGISTPHVTEPVSALIAACQHLGVTRIGLVSPYVAAVSDRLRAVLAEAGINVAHFASFDQAEEAKVARIDAASVARAAEEMARAPDCEAVFLSCTNLRTLEVIADVEALTGTLVLSSNQVLAWHLCRLIGHADLPRGFGRLFDTRAYA